VTVAELGTGMPCSRQATLTRRAQRAVSDAYGIIVNVITSDQHNWCARRARTPTRPHSAQTCPSLVDRTQAMLSSHADVHAVAYYAIACTVSAPYGRGRNGAVFKRPWSRGGNFFLRRFQRYKPELVKVPREIFLTYIAPVHYNGIRRAPPRCPAAQRRAWRAAALRCWCAGGCEARGQATWDSSKV